MLVVAFVTMSGALWACGHLPIIIIIIIQVFVVLIFLCVIQWSLCLRCLLVAYFLGQSSHHGSCAAINHHLHVSNSLIVSGATAVSYGLHVGH